METKITAETAQLYTSQHLQDAIMSMELAQEYTITSQIGNSDKIGISDVRLMITYLLDICKSQSGLGHFRNINAITNGITFLKERI